MVGGAGGDPSGLANDNSGILRDGSHFRLVNVSPHSVDISESWFDRSDDIGKFKIASIDTSVRVFATFDTLSPKWREMGLNPAVEWPPSPTA